MCVCKYIQRSDDGSSGKKETCYKLNNYNIHRITGDMHLIINLRKRKNICLDVHKAKLNLPKMELTGFRITWLNAASPTNVSVSLKAT